MWRECFRVLRSAKPGSGQPGGSLLAGFLNPLTYIFDLDLADEEGRLEVKYPIPYSDLTTPPDEVRQRLLAEGAPFEFGHTLDDQIGGQLDAGFVITGFYEDRWPDFVLDKYIATFIATRATKL